MARTSMRAMAWPIARSLKNAASDSTSGSSGMVPVCGPIRTIHTPVDACGQRWWIAQGLWITSARDIPERNLMAHSRCEELDGPGPFRSRLVEHLGTPPGQLGEP